MEGAESRPQNLNAGGRSVRRYACECINIRLVMSIACMHVTVHIRVVIFDTYMHVCAHSRRYIRAYMNVTVCKYIVVMCALFKHVTAYKSILVRGARE